MKSLKFLILILVLISLVFAEEYQNSAEKLLASTSKLSIGGYGEIHYNQPFDGNTRYNGKMDVHRFVMLMAYQFDSNTRFVTEIEYEHVKEVYIEQAFLQHRINNKVNFEAGLLLIPMGIINKYHEPVTFNGVERPIVDKYIVPTTWREIGAGVSGNLISQSLKYQLYLVNGFNGFDGSAKLTGGSGFRKGRQKGAESYISSPNLTGRMEYYGLPNLNLGVSGYFGKTQSILYDGVGKDNELATNKADSSTVGIAMVGLDARYQKKGLYIRGQLYYSGNSNSNAYNEFTGSDLGSAMVGGYAEVGYDIFRLTEFATQLIPFIRLEIFDTHNAVEASLARNDAYNRFHITSGLSWKLTAGTVLKIDMQLMKDQASDDYSKVINTGVGIAF